jgi:hypothetical protein
MIFDISKPGHKQKAENYFAKLIEGKKRFELKILHPKRSLPQNSYLHSLFSLYGLFFGGTIEEVKTDIKIDLGYIYAKNGRNYLKHTSDMTTKELTNFIEKFRNLSASRGKYLPAPNELSDDDLNDISRNQQYLTGRFE